MSKKGYKQTLEHKIKRGVYNQKCKKISLETRKKMKESALSRKIKPPSNKGKMFSINHRKKISESKKGKSINLGRIPTMQQREKVSLSLRGDKAPNWKGGLTQLKKLIRETFKYRQWRSDVFTRDDFTCQRCFKKGCYLEAHHIKKFSNIIQEYHIRTVEESLEYEELWNINNGQTLCIICHNKTKSGG